MPRYTKFRHLSNDELISKATDAVDKLNGMLKTGNVLIEVLADNGHADHLEMVTELLERFEDVLFGNRSRGERKEQLEDFEYELRKVPDED